MEYVFFVRAFFLYNRLHNLESSELKTRVDSASKAKTPSVKKGLSEKTKNIDKEVSGDGGEKEKGGENEKISEVGGGGGGSSGSW